MTFEESYQRYLILSESNGVTDNLATTKQSYAYLFNLSQNRIIEWFIENNNSDENRYIQKLKVPHKPLTKVISKPNRDQFSLPKDYFEFIDLFAYGSSERCKDQFLNTKEAKQENISNYLVDEFSKPSFKYRESFFTIAQDQIEVYKDKDFDITKTEITYYRVPKQITLVDSDNPESPFRQEDLEFDDKLTNRIILMAVSYHQLSSDDPKWQAFKQETIQKF